jgi:hypothetical protein
MNPKLSLNNFTMATLGVARAAYQSSAGSLTRPPRSRKDSPEEQNGPYPGICICSASELLDFGFENTEFLQGKED